MAQKEDVAGYDVAKACPKRMLNGPCGGVVDGMCEVEGACVWVKVYERLNSENKLNEFTKVRMPRVE